MGIHGRTLERPSATEGPVVDTGGGGLGLNEARGQNRSPTAPWPPSYR